MNRSGSYSDNWDSFYQKTYGSVRSGKALWDVPVEDSAALDIPYMQTRFSPALPLLDVGCGTGEIARFFGDFFPHVVGIDVSAKAIDIANGQAGNDNVTFRVLDMTDRQACEALAMEFGPMHLYIRGVMHQIELPDLPAYVQNIRTLLGGQGSAYMMEVAAHIREHFLQASSQYHQLPKAIQEIFIANLPPRGVTLEDVSRNFIEPDFRITLCEPSYLQTNLTFNQGEKVLIPAVRAILQTK